MDDARLLLSIYARIEINIGETEIDALLPRGVWAKVKEPRKPAGLSNYNRPIALGLYKDPKKPLTIIHKIDQGCKLG